MNTLALLGASAIAALGGLSYGSGPERADSGPSGVDCSFSVPFELRDDEVNPSYTLMGDYGSFVEYHLELGLDIWASSSFSKLAGPSKTVADKIFTFGPTLDVRCVRGSSSYKVIGYWEYPSHFWNFTSGNAFYSISSFWASVTPVPNGGAAKIALTSGFSIPEYPDPSGSARWDLHQSVVPFQTDNVFCSFQHDVSSSEAFDDSSPDALEMSFMYLSHPALSAVFPSLKMGAVCTQLNYTTEYEYLDIWSLMSAVLTMPFTFLSSFWTTPIFSGTPYQFVPSVIIYSLFAIILIYGIVRLILGFLK